MCETLPVVSGGGRARKPGLEPLPHLLNLLLDSSGHCGRDIRVRDPLICVEITTGRAADTKRVKFFTVLHSAPRIKAPSP